MTSPDSLVHALAFGDTVRVVAATTAHTITEAIRRHQAMPTASAAFGRALTAALLVRSTYKGDERVTLRFDSNGPFAPLTARALPDGTVHGVIANPQAMVPPRDGRLDVAGGVGRVGLLTVTVERPDSEPFTSTIPLASGEIGDDVAQYYQDSEQTRSAVGLGVLLAADRSVSAAGGFIVQLLGDVPDDAVAEVEARLSALPSVAGLIEGGADAVELVRRLAGDDARVLAQREIAWRCPRVREDIVARIAALGRAATDELFPDEEPVEVVCEYCCETYRITLAEVRAAASRAST